MQPITIKEKYLYKGSTKMASHSSGNTERIIAWYRHVKQRGLPFWIVFIIAVYTPFEDFFVKWVPGPTVIATFLHFVPEITLYILLIYLVLQSLRHPDKILRKTPIDSLVILFFIAAIISIIINDSPLPGSLYNLRVLWRYLSIYYITVNIEISPSQLSFLLKSINFAGVLESIVVFIQFFLPTSINQILFAPRSLEIGDVKKVSQAEEGSFKPGSAFGTFDNTAVLSTFLLVISVIFWNYLYTKFGNLIPSAKEFVKLFFIYFAMFASKKRIALVILLILPIIILWLQKRKRKAALVSWLLIALAFLAIIGISVVPSKGPDPSSISNQPADTYDKPYTPEETNDNSSYFTKIFTPEFLTDPKENSRMWVATVTINAIFNSGSWFGFGPELETAKKAMLDFIPDPADQQRLINFIPYEDFYWVAMIAYYGFIGIGIYFLILLRLYQVARWLIRHSSVKEYKSLGVTFCTLTIIAVSYNFVERILILRTFGLYFWLLAGLVVNARYSQKALSSS